MKQNSEFIVTPPISTRQGKLLFAEGIRDSREDLVDVIVVDVPAVVAVVERKDGFAAFVENDDVGLRVGAGPDEEIELIGGRDSDPVTDLLVGIQARVVGSVLGEFIFVDGDAVELEQRAVHRPERGLGICVERARVRMSVVDGIPALQCHAAGQDRRQYEEENRRIPHTFIVARLLIREQ